MAGVSSHTKSAKINGLDIDLEGNLGKYTESASHVHAVVDFFGPTNFLMMNRCGSRIDHDAEDSPESSLIGGAIQDFKLKTELANPMNYVNEKTPPFLILHGDQDSLVPHCQSQELHKVLHEKNVRSKLIIVEGGGHGPGVMITHYYDQMIDFLKATFGKANR
jgi:dipeptidyl aminopeptidase/acylaminoacyl peptidase